MPRLLNIDLTTFLVGTGWTVFMWYHCVKATQEALRSTERHEKRNLWLIAGGTAVAGWAALLLMVHEMFKRA